MSNAANLLERYGPWALVTGASDGIGRAFATELAAAGLSVVLVARRKEVLDELALALHAQHGVQTAVVATDLSTADGRGKVTDVTESLSVGLLVAAAGFGTSGSFLDTAPEDEARMLDLNCGAVLALTHEYAARFAERGRGGIVLLSSLVAFQGVPRAANYAATKAYVQTLAEGLQRELGPQDIDVLACAPGPVKSGFAAVADMQMGTAVSPETVARGALRALGRRTTVRPGLQSKFLTLTLSTLPRALRVRAMERVMGGFTAHQ